MEKEENEPSTALTKTESLNASSQSLSQISGGRTRRLGSAEVTSSTAAMLVQSQMSRIGARLSQPDLQTPPAAPGTGGTIKERMQRRRREREAAAAAENKANGELNGVIENSSSSSSLSSMVNSTDLASLRQKFAGEDIPKLPPVIATRQTSVDNNVDIVKDETDSHGGGGHGHTNCNHPTCMAQRMTRAAAMRGTRDDRASSYNLANSSSRLSKTRSSASASELRNLPSLHQQQSHEDRHVLSRRRKDSLDQSRNSLTADTESSRARRLAGKDNWKGSQHSLPESETTSKRTPRSRLGSKDSWHGSNQSLVGEGGDSSSLATRETRSSILRREAARLNQRNSQISGDSSNTRAQRLSGWRGSQQSLNDTKSPTSSSRPAREAKAGLHSSQPSLADSDNNRLFRRRDSSEGDGNKSRSTAPWRTSRDRRGSNQSDNSLDTTGSKYSNGGSHLSMDTGDAVTSKTGMARRPNNRGLRTSAQSLVGDENKATSKRGSSVLKSAAPTDKDSRETLRKLPRSRNNLSNSQSNC